MNGVSRDLFRAICEGKWLKIEYRNQSGDITSFWIAVRDLNPEKGTLDVEGLHLARLSVAHLEKIFFSSILTSHVVEGTWYPVNEKLRSDIEDHPERYSKIFGNSANLKILTYLEMCSRLDCVPYCRDFSLIHRLDLDRINEETVPLSEDQFREIVSAFSFRMKKEEGSVPSGKMQIRSLAMNVLSIHTKKGLYVLASRELNLDVEGRCLRPAENITVSREFTLQGEVMSARKFLDAEDEDLLDDFENNLEKIKDRIQQRGGRRKAGLVDDMPYVIGLQSDIPLDLHSEYQAIIEEVENKEETWPIRAFFGELVEKPRRRKASPMALVTQHINMDQLLAINNAMQYPLAYVQGPPGTGKTQTIINTIATAFFNGRTVLFSSYNNTPIDGVTKKLQNLQYQGKTIPFPILRLGSRDRVQAAVPYIRSLWQRAQEIQVPDRQLDQNKEERRERAAKLSRLLRTYDSLLDLSERKQTLSRMLEEEQKGMSMATFPFTADLMGRQLPGIEKEIEKQGEIREQDAVSLLDPDREGLFSWMYYTSAKYLQRLSGPAFEDLREILAMEDDRKAGDAFLEYLSDSDSITRLQRVFPVMVTTAISAHRIGRPEPLFDMVIMDEASQCNTAISLVPIVRGESLMLVGDPQQLSPVILLDKNTNEVLKARYQVGEEYDYRENSVYKTFLACDCVSDEVLLRSHYRCSPEIIDFNNRKYYGGKLQVMTEEEAGDPLLFIDSKGAQADAKNTSPQEAAEAIRFAAEHPDASIGIVTPFVAQKELLEQEARQAGLRNVEIGTVHSFQGEEKDIILFSTAITEETAQGTYDWLKNNRELINVATSRARKQLVVLSDRESLEKLKQDGDDDLYDLVRYVESSGKSSVTSRTPKSRALGIKPYSTKTEDAFLASLHHALENIWLSEGKYRVHKEVPISQVFEDNTTDDSLFYTGRFDFVIYQVHSGREIPMLAIELDGREHLSDAAVRARDEKKKRICRAHHLELLRVDNTYARRYYYIKNILLSYFQKAR